MDCARGCIGLVLPCQYLTGNSRPHLVILVADDTDKLFIICELANDYEPDDRDQDALPCFLRRIDNRVHREGFWTRLKKRILKSVPENEENTTNHPE